MRIKYRGYRLIGRPGKWEVFDPRTGTIWLGEVIPTCPKWDRERLYFRSLLEAMKAVNEDISSFREFCKEAEAASRFCNALNRWNAVWVRRHS